MMPGELRQYPDPHLTGRHHHGTQQINQFAPDDRGNGRLLRFLHRWFRGQQAARGAPTGAIGSESGADHLDSIILGKAVTSFVLGVASITVFVVATTLLLGADLGNPLGVALLVVAAVVAAMGVLAIVASVRRRTSRRACSYPSYPSCYGLLGGTFSQCRSLAASSPRSASPAPSVVHARARRPRGRRGIGRPPVREDPWRLSGGLIRRGLGLPAEGGSPMKALVIAANSVRRLLRERADLFFVFALPHAPHLRARCGLRGSR